MATAVDRRFAVRNKNREACPAVLSYKPRMAEYRGRRAMTISNGTLRVTVLEEGGHIAEITDMATGVNPLWTPHWPSIEPSAYDPARDTIYGGGADASLLAGIMGHNLCLDIFGGPSDA